jgi:hypothetical protein
MEESQEESCKRKAKDLDGQKQAGRQGCRAVCIYISGGERTVGNSGEGLLQGPVVGSLRCRDQNQPNRSLFPIPNDF